MMKIEKVGMKEAKEKLRVELVYPECIEGMAEVLTLALKKYKANSWQNVKDPLDTHYASLLRHLLTWRKGEINDKESGLSHMKHVLTNAMFLLDHEQKGRI